MLLLCRELSQTLLLSDLAYQGSENLNAYLISR
jgi:hypothetical protein